MQKVKKPFYKKWWVWLIGVIVIVAIVTSDDEGKVVNEDTDAAKKTVATSTEIDNEKDDVTKEESVEDETEDVEKDKEEEIEEAIEEKTAIKAGTYKVGTDIAPGEYLVFSSGHTYIESAKDSSGNLDSIIFNDNIMSDAHTYVTLNEGEYFKMTGGEMYPVEDADSVIPENGLYQDGMYKVGQDIPAGEYKVILTSSLGMGYLEVSSDSSHQLGSIVTNDNVQADTYITVKENQYLKLQGLEIQK